MSEKIQNNIYYVELRKAYLEWKSIYNIEDHLKDAGWTQRVIQKREALVDKMGIYAAAMKLDSISDADLNKMFDE